MKRLFNFSSRFKILKGGKISLIVSALIGSTTISFAAPTGGTITSGQATINQTGNITNINQISNKATINWQNFSIASNETVNFNQPNSNAITLNRVIGNEKSIINGALNANGQVWLLNSNGVLFGKNASINTSGLLTTTAKLSDEDFNAGIYNFKNASTNSIINQGIIKIANSGSVILASNEVINQGTIKAVKGNIYLLGANAYSINLNGNSLVNLTVDKGVLDAMVSNSGTILAEGGEIYLTTNAVDELLKGVVNNTGIIEANSIDDLTGHIELFAHGGSAQIDGKIEAIDGFIETSGKNFTISEDSKIKAKEWLIDPVNLIVNNATAYETALNNGTDTTIQTDNSTGTDEGNIYIVDTIDWTSTAKLTLDAYNDIYINADITATQGSLALHYGQALGNAGNTSNYYIDNATINLSAGNNFFTQLGNDVSETAWTVITELGAEGSTTGTDLQGINGNLSGNYVLGADINGSSTSTWNSGKGWNGIGDEANIDFTGNFDGLGHTINNVYMNRLDPQVYFGLFDKVRNATIKNLTLSNFNITAQNSNTSSSSATAALAGYSYNSSIDNIKIINSVVSGKRGVGALAGQTSESYISNSSVVGGSVAGTLYNIGGLVGSLNSNSELKNSYADTTVTGGSENTGGLVGFVLNGSTVENSYAKGSVSGSLYVGGLVGNINDSTTTITNSYASNTVTGIDNGGLVGDNSIGASIIESYYDNEVNTDNSMNDTSLGRTKAQILQLVTDSTWDNTIWGTQASDFEGYGTSSFSLPELVALYNGPTLFEYGYGTANSPYRITNWTQLQNINYNVDTLTDGQYYYTLTNDLTTSMADYTSVASSSANSGAGWLTLGDDTNSGFMGSFDGQGHIIDGLYINSNHNATGLFGYASSATIENIGLTNVDISGLDNTGALVGVNFNTTITNSYSTGNLYAAGVNFGGLVGQNNDNLSEINYSYSSVNVTGSGGSNRTGGLVGWNTSGASVKNSYATGSVSAGDGVGGLVGSHENASPIENSYSTGSVSGTGSWLGGLIGWSNSTTTNSFWDTQTSGQTTSAGGTGLTSAQMSYGKIFYDASWDIVADNNVTSSTPILKYDSVNDKYVWAISPLVLSYNLGSKTTTYDGTNQSLNDFYTSSSTIFGSEYNFLNLTASDYAFQVNGTNVTEYTNAGTYSDIKLALTNSNNFLALANTGNVDGNLTINKANATVTANSNVVTYNGTSQNINGYTVLGLVNNEASSVLDSITGDSATGTNAGTYNTSLSGTDDNYNLTFIDGTLTIDKANATVTVNPNTVTYNGQAQSSGFTARGLVNGETESVLNGVSVSSATNAGTYTLSASGTDENYNLTFVDGQLIIQKANATVTVNNDTVTYNGQAQSSGFTARGLVNGETESVLNGVSVSSATNAGTYTLSASGTDENYNLTFVDGQLVINKVNALVNINDASKTQGESDPILTYTITGLLNEDTLSGSIIRQEGEKVGTYDITKGSLTAGDNYILSVNNGIFTINRNTQTENNQLKDSKLENTVTSIIKTAKTKNPTNDNNKYLTDPIFPPIQIETNENKEKISNKDNFNKIEESINSKKINPEKSIKKETTESVSSKETSTKSTNVETNSKEKTETKMTKENQTKINESMQTENSSTEQNSNKSEQNKNSSNKTDSKQNTEETNNSTNENSMSENEEKVVVESKDSLKSNTEDNNIQLNDAQIEMTVDENGNIVHSKSEIEVKVKNNGQLIFGDNSSDVLETIGLAIKNISVQNNQIEIIIFDKKNNNNTVKYSATLANGKSLPTNLIINTKTGKVTGTLLKSLKKVEIFIKAVDEDNTVRIVGLKIKLNKF